MVYYLILMARIGTGCVISAGYSEWLWQEVVVLEEKGHNKMIQNN